MKLPPSVNWQERRLELLDQTRLPGEVVLIAQHTVTDVWWSIREMKVRGAPAIGIAAAYGLLLGLDADRLTSRQALRDELRRRGDYLKTARPTAVNLAWAVDRMLAAAESRDLPTADLLQCLVQEAESIHDEDRRLCRALGEAGLELMRPGLRVLTHCNAGSLAVSELGTALAPLYLAHEQGCSLQVYVDETRPLLQGARLTAFELQQAGIRVTLLCDSMAASLMADSQVDLVLVGADRVTRNGDVINKIGTLNLAVLCRYYSVPFYVACPWPTLDMSLAAGNEVTLEHRAGDEVRRLGSELIAPGEVDVYNPAFDVTPAELVTGLNHRQRADQTASAGGVILPLGETAGGGSGWRKLKGSSSIS